MKSPAWVSLLGLAFRAQKVVTGSDGVLESIRNQKAKIVLLSDDASENTTKLFKDKCHFYQVNLVTVLNRQTLGMAVGKPERVVVAVIDEGFADKLKQLLDSESRG